MLEFHDRPGNMLENYLNQLCGFLNGAGFHAHKNNPLRTYEGKYIQGEPFDYEFFIHGKVYCFDAKENMSGGLVWRLRLTGSRGAKTNARILKQASNLLNCKRNGAEAFFLVAFNNKSNLLPYSLVMYDAELVYNSLINRIRTLGFDQGSEFDIDKIINQKE